METIYIILGLIMLVFGILQIILFFKLWKMTNDVHAIKENKPVDKNTPEDTFWEFRKYILLNNVEKAEEIVLAIFLNNVRKDIAANPLVILSLLLRIPQIIHTFVSSGYSIVNMDVSEMGGAFPTRLFCYPRKSNASECNSNFPSSSMVAIVRYRVPAGSNPIL